MRPVELSGGGRFVGAATQRRPRGPTPFARARSLQLRRAMRNVGAAWGLITALAVGAACVDPLPDDQIAGRGGGGGAIAAGAGGAAPSTGGAGGASTTGGPPVGGGSGPGAAAGGRASTGGSGTMPAGAVSGSAGAVTLTPEEWSTVMAMSPLPSLPSDTTNRFADDPAAARLGQRLFFDASTSGPLPVGGGALRLSCASCHAGPAMSEPAPELQPAMMGPYSVKRNALGLVNASHYRWVNWGGRFAAQWELPLAVAENPNILASSRLQIVHLLYSRYRADYEAIFGPLEPALGTDLVRFPSIGKPKATDAPDGPWESMKPADRELVNRAFVNYGKSIAAYLRRLVSGNSRFDAFVAGDRGALTPFELGGLRLFVGRAGCTGCHGGPRFTDDAFHDLGVKPAVPDNGRFDDVPPLLASPFNVDGPYSDDRMTGRLAGLKPTPDLTNLFRTPSLRDVALTAPYLHNGRSPTLDDAIRTHLASASFVHDPLLQPIALSPDEIGALVAFLGSLTSAPLPSELLAAPAR